MSPDEFVKMLNDIGKKHKTEGLKIEPAEMYLPEEKKTYGFGYKKANGYFKHVWEFKDLVKNVKVCDWLDSHNFKRPKWSPDGILNKEYI